MKHSATGSLLLVAIVSAFAIISCSKNGPQGATGPAGPAGTTGATGAQGAAGSVNVVYSQWFAPPAYTKDTLFGIGGFYYNKATTDITNAVVDSGIVLTYGKLLGYNPQLWPVNQIGQLPITLTYIQGSTMTDTWTAFATTGNLKIQFVNDQNYYFGVSNAHQFRYIIIPGGQKSAVASEKPGTYYSSGRQLDANAVNDVIQNYAQMSYSQVCRRLGIAE